jgi:monoamine oxidase
LGAFGFLHAPQEPFPTWWTASPVRAPLLTGWAGGPAAVRLAGRRTEVVLDLALQSLASVLSVSARQIAGLLEAWHLADWENDPFARGAYSYVGIDGLAAPQELAAPVAGTVFFAGEATHEFLSGTVGGALASGRRAGDEALQAAG